MTPRRALIAAALFAATALLVGWRSLGYYWNWDDLHLIRPYSPSELARVFTTQWALSSYETKGLRPFTTLFNHARWSLFGEDLVAHRLFLIGLFVAYLTLLAWLVSRLGGKWITGLIAGLVTLCAKNSYYHFLWISDGIHIFQALLFVAAAHVLVTGLDRDMRTAFAGAWLLTMVALLTREDSLVIFPALVTIAVFHSGRRPRFRADATRLVRFTIMLVIGWFAIWVWRLYAVPDAPQFKFVWESVVRVWNMALWAICLSGQSEPARYFYIALFLAALTVAFRLESSDRRFALLWLSLTAVAVLPGNVRAVPNLLLFAVSFYAIFLATVLWGVARTHALGRIVAALTVAFILATSFRASRAEQISLHPLSADQMRRDWMFIYGQYRDAAIPGIRVRTLRAKLDRYGVTSPTFDFDRWRAALQAEGRVRPDGRGPFAPPRLFLSP